MLRQSNWSLNFSYACHSFIKHYFKTKTFFKSIKLSWNIFLKKLILAWLGLKNMLCHRWTLLWPILCFLSLLWNNLRICRKSVMLHFCKESVNGNMDISEKIGRKMKSQAPAKIRTRNLLIMSCSIAELPMQCHVQLNSSLMKTLMGSQYYLLSYRFKRFLLGLSTQ